MVSLGQDRSIECLGSNAVRARIGQGLSGMGRAVSTMSWDPLSALGLSAVTTACLMVITRFVDLEHISSVYLIPVLIAATRWGVVPAIAAAVGGIAASAFFFYPPIYDFRVHDLQQLFDLPLFLIVAAVTGRLATTAHAHASRAQVGEQEMRALYAFSRRLSVATDEAQIYAAIQDQLSHTTGCRVVYFAPRRAPSSANKATRTVPKAIVAAVEGFDLGQGSVHVRDDATRNMWVIHAMYPRNPAFGLVAIDTGNTSADSALLAHIDAVVSDARATLDRLDVARALGEARLRSEAETLRAALMGSVSHGLRTPLASIVGAASILAEAPPILADPRLNGLADIVRDEAERLNADIQRLLDASRISATGVHPHLAWSDVADIVNAAVASQRRRLAENAVTVRVCDDLPLVHVDAVLIEQALGQVLDNAAKYSPPHAPILVEARSGEQELSITVSDQAVGLSKDEHAHIFERFYRGSRTRDSTTGSGLGLWIARAFVVACGGRMEAASAGEGQGSTISIVLPVSKQLPSQVESGDE